MEESAFVKIAHRIRQKAFETGNAYSLNSLDAEDVAQEVMLKLWAMHDELDGVHSIEALACTMARRLSIDEYRRSRATAIHSKDEHIASADSTPADMLEDDENEKWLARKIDLLPTTQHTILYMRQVEHRTNKEIANIIGIEETSVVTLLARARKSLLEDFKKRINMK